MFKLYYEKINFFIYKYYLGYLVVLLLLLLLLLVISNYTSGLYVPLRYLRSFSTSNDNFDRSNPP